MKLIREGQQHISSEGTTKSIQEREQKKETKEYIRGLQQFIGRCVSPFHTVETVEDILREQGFHELSMTEPFLLSAGEGYFVSVYDSSLMAFTVGKDSVCQKTAAPVLKCVSSHTDFPGFKLKPDCIMYAENKSGLGYIKLNTEVYGGPILNTWLDRPLSVAGRLMIRGEEDFEVKSLLVDAARPVLIIPNLAIHMNREVNKGVELNKQKELLPVASLISGKEYSTDAGQNRYTDVIMLLFEKELEKKGIKREEVLDYELYLYNQEEGCLVGAEEQLYSSPRLDNLVSVFAQTRALISGKRDKGINMALFFDNEEIGSKTKQGAASQVVSLLMEKIFEGLGMTRKEMIDALLGGFMLSVDVAHAIHPNYPEKNDPTNQVMPDKGIVFKVAASQSYANDAKGTAQLKQLCDKYGIPVQYFVNRSDMPGGQTLGAISSTVLPMRTIDIGIPLLSMHSARELMGTEDEKNLEKFLTVFYS